MEAAVSASQAPAGISPAEADVVAAAAVVAIAVTATVADSAIVGPRWTKVANLSALLKVAVVVAAAVAELAGVTKLAPAEVGEVTTGNCRGVGWRIVARRWCGC